MKTDINYQTLLFETDKRGVAYLTLNRSDVHNAMNAQLIAEMQSALKHIENTDSIRVVVLSGAGQTFCAGGDLTWMKSNISITREERIIQSGELATMLAMLDSLSKPLIGKIQGSAYGGGIGMISVCDMAFGVEGTQFGLTEVKLGLAPATISPYVIKRIGVTQARRNFLNARIFDAQEALRINLLTDIVDSDKLDETIENEIKLILKCGPKAIALTKSLIHFVSNNNDKDNYSYTSNVLADAWEGLEGKEGIDAFLSKRKPNWS